MGCHCLIMPQSSESIALHMVALRLRDCQCGQRSDWREAAWSISRAEFHGLIAVVVQAGMPACIFKRREIRVS